MPCIDNMTLQAALGNLRQPLSDGTRLGNRCPNGCSSPTARAAIIRFILCALALHAPAGRVLVSATAHAFLRR